MRLTRIVIPIGLLMMASAATAQDRPSSLPASGTPVKLQVVMTRYEGEKKASSMPYTVLFNAAEPNEKPVAKTIMMGVQVPLQTIVRDAPTVAFKDVGARISGTATSVGGGRYRLILDIEQSFVADGQGRSGITVGPVLRTFRDSIDVVLRDGQTTQSSSATDPVTGEVLKIDLTLAVVK